MNRQEKALNSHGRGLGRGVGARVFAKGDEPATCEWCGAEEGREFCPTADRTIYACSNYKEPAA